MMHYQISAEKWATEDPAWPKFLEAVVGHAKADDESGEPLIVPAGVELAIEEHECGYDGPPVIDVSLTPNAPDPLDQRAATVAKAEVELEHRREFVAKREAEANAKLASLGNIEASLKATIRELREACPVTEAELREALEDELGTEEEHFLTICRAVRQESPRYGGTIFLVGVMGFALGGFAGWMASGADWPWLLVQ